VAPLGDKDLCFYVSNNISDSGRIRCEPSGEHLPFFLSLGHGFRQGFFPIIRVEIVKVGRKKRTHW